MGDEQLKRYRSQAQRRYAASSSSSSSSSYSSLSSSLDADEVLAQLLAREEQAMNRANASTTRRTGRGRGRWGVGVGRGGRGQNNPQTACIPSELMLTDMRRSGPPSSPSFDIYLQQAAYENERLNQAFLNSIMSQRDQYIGRGFGEVTSASSNDRDVIGLMSRELTDADYNTLLNLEDVKNTRGASEIDISRLPTFTFRKRNANQSENHANESAGKHARGDEIFPKRRKKSNDRTNQISGVKNAEGVIVIDSDDDGVDCSRNTDHDSHNRTLDVGGQQDIKGVIVLLDDSPQPKNEVDTFLAPTSAKPNDNTDAGANITEDPVSCKDQEEDEDASCCICMEDYQTGDHMITLPCLHVFHRDCIIPWLKNCASCPIDKSKI